MATNLVLPQVACARCGAVFSQTRRERRFCSVECQVANNNEMRHNRRRKAPVCKRCDLCGDLFTVGKHPKQRFCGRKCRDRSWAIEHGHTPRSKPKPEPSPLEWDGKTRFNADAPTRRRDYELACMACGRGVWVYLLESELKLLPAARCAHCSGRMFLNLDAGKATIGYGKPMRTYVVSHREHVESHI